MSSSNASHPAPRQFNATDLPLEILDLILQHCGVANINTKISFKLSCPRFYDTAGSLRLLSRVVQSDANLRFERICMDDESESQRTGRRVCCVCKQRHPADLFVDDELKKRAVDRVGKNCQRHSRLTSGASFPYATLNSYVHEWNYGRKTHGDYVALRSSHNEDFEFWP